MDQGFKGQTAVVTGGAGGIGQAVAADLLAGGANVVIVDRDGAALERAGAALGSDRLLAVAADVTNKEDVAGYVARTLSRFGAIDLFHNNAGIATDGTTLLDFTVDGYRRLFDVNVLGVLLGLQAVGRVMIEQGKGSIVNTGSVTAFRSAAGYALYGATKAAVHRLTQHAAVELGPRGVRVNAIAPGPVDTPLFRGGFQAEGRSQEEADRLAMQAAANRPIGRASTPGEAAELVTFLLGNRSRTITGAIYTIDGGVTA